MIVVPFRLFDLGPTGTCWKDFLMKPLRWACFPTRMLGSGSRKKLPIVSHVRDGTRLFLQRRYRPRGRSRCLKVALIEFPHEIPKSCSCNRIIGSMTKGSAKFLQSFSIFFSIQMNPSHVQVGKLSRFVAPGGHCLPQPGFCFVHLAFLHEVDADVVVRIAEVGIQLDGNLTMLNRLLKIPSKTVHPAQEGMGIGGGMGLNGLCVVLNRTLDVSFPVAAISFL